MKPNSHIFTLSNQLPIVLDVFRAEAKTVNAKLHEVSTSREQLSPSVEASVSYPTQVDNACLAAAVLKHLGVSTEGMSQFYWPCRMEMFTVNGVTVVLDGCHNGDSVQKFLQGALCEI